MPRIGMRIVKSSLAVFICFVVYILRNEQGIVFYSCIAAVLCVQQNTANTIKVAKNRVEGTLIGGFIGLLVLVFEKSVIPHEFIFIQYTLIAFMIIPLIYITVLMKKTSASYISCVVFMSITVSHGADINPYMFALDRMLDTLIGIFVALFINCVHVPYKIDRHTKQYISLDTLPKEKHLLLRGMIQLNQKMERGVPYVFICEETPACYASILKDIRYSTSLLCFKRTLAYNSKQYAYQAIHIFSEHTFENMYAYLKELSYTPFVYVVIYEMLQIYFMASLNQEEEAYYKSVRNQRYEHYIYGNKPKDSLVSAIMILVPIEKEAIFKRNLLTNFSDCQLQSKPYSTMYTKQYILPIPHN